MATIDYSKYGETKNQVDYSNYGIQENNSDDLKESFRSALAKSPFRVGEDIYRGGMNVLKSLPGYVQSAKSEVPGLIRSLKDHPSSVGKQALAGMAELGQNVFNAPHDIINYLSTRLNLVPQDVNKMIQMGRMPSDTQDMINQTFGTPQHPGEALARGLTRDMLNIGGIGGIANKLNPMNLTAKSIAKDVVKTGKKQEVSHNKLYNKIWNEADNSGFNQVPVDQKLLSDNLSVIEKYKTPREYQSLEDFILDPTLKNAQKAQSDMGIMHRKLEENSRNRALTSEERALYDSAKQSELHIENNMFKNMKGEANKNLKNLYDDVTKSYRENVVPYKYNSDIQAYKNKEMLPKELVNSLSRGEFAAKKGKEHPAIWYRNMLKPAITGAGLAGGSLWLYNQMFGNEPAKQ